MALQDPLFALAAGAVVTLAYSALVTVALAAANDPRATTTAVKAAHVIIPLPLGSPGVYGSTGVLVCRLLENWARIGLWLGLGVGTGVIGVGTGVIEGLLGFGKALPQAAHPMRPRAQGMNPLLAGTRASPPR